MLSRQMRFPLAASFVDRGSGERAHGLVRIADEQHLLLWTAWRYRPRDEDRTWDWWGIYRECGKSGSRYECYAALAENDLQGLMVLDIKLSRTGTGKGLIVDYLATNPSNRKATGGFKYVGIALMAVAITRSIEQGAGGRIWLESLSGAAGFYEGLGMAKHTRRSAEGNLIYMLDPATAEQLLDEIRGQGILVL